MVKNTSEFTRKRLMKLLNKTSLTETVDNLNDAIFFGKVIPDNQVGETVDWIVGRQGMPGAYAGMFAPTERDFKDGARLFTGEKITSGAGIAHVLGQETCRLLIQFDVDDHRVKEALNTASSGMLERLVSSEDRHAEPVGMYCCGTCTPALWRHLAVGGLDNQDARLKAGVNELKNYRDDTGKWRRFPFWWTMLALSEMKFSSAKEEMRYAAVVLERCTKRKSTGDKYIERKRALAEKILSNM